MLLIQSHVFATLSRCLINFLPSKRFDITKIEQIDGMISKEEALFLYTLARSAPPGCIIEIGSFRGKSTVALALGARDNTQVTSIYAIEPHEPFTGILGGTFGPEDRGAFYHNMLRTDAYQSVRLVNLPSEMVAPNWKFPVSLLWIDGDHEYDAVKRDVISWLPHLTSQAIVAFDDAANDSLGPKRIINELISSADFHQLRRCGKILALIKTS